MGLCETVRSRVRRPAGTAPRSGPHGRQSRRPAALLNAVKLFFACACACADLQTECVVVAEREGPAYLELQQDGAQDSKVVILVERLEARPRDVREGRVRGGLL